MKSKSVWCRVHASLAALQWLFGFVVVIVSACLKIELNKLPGWARFAESWIQWLQETGALIILVSAILAGVLGIIRKQIGPPWVWQHVHFLLDSFRDFVFDTDEGDLHHHRITLFKHRRCRGWWTFGAGSGWLVPVERSGHTTLKSRAAFRAPDAADKAQGIAGYTWARKRMIFVEDLPDICNGGTPEALLAFAKATRITPQWLVKHKVCSRSFCGIPIEVQGNIWGVLVLDSRSPKISQKTELIANFYRINGRYVAKLLERA